jgi:hypothetical protein
MGMTTITKGEAGGGGGMMDIEGGRGEGERWGRRRDDGF